MNLLTPLIPPAIVILLLVGCGDDSKVQSQNEANRAIMPAWSAYTSGEAAEVRMWKTEDQTTWMVVGRSASFVIFSKPPTGGDWQQRYTNSSTNIPPAIKVQVEHP